MSNEWLGLATAGVGIVAGVLLIVFRDRVSSFSDRSPSDKSSPFQGLQGSPVVPAMIGGLMICFGLLFNLAELLKIAGVLKH